MINRDKLKYFTMAAWLRGYAEGINQDELVSPAIPKKLIEAAAMLDFVFNNEIGDENDTE